MIKLQDIEKIILSDSEFALCQQHSIKCSLGGVSRIRKNDERQRLLGEDQIVGQVCTCAMAIWVYGKPGVELYDSIRKKQNEHPEIGDGGVDLPPFKLDVKGSKIRSFSKSVLTYNLLVRPKERHQDWIYVLALTSPPKVALMGWIRDENLPNLPENDGIFKGAFRKVAYELLPMKQLRDAL